MLVSSQRQESGKLSSSICLSHGQLDYKWFSVNEGYILLKDLILVVVCTMQYKWVNVWCLKPKVKYCFIAVAIYIFQEMLTTLSDRLDAYMKSAAKVKKEMEQQIASLKVHSWSSLQEIEHWLPSWFLQNFFAASFLFPMEMFGDWTFSQEFNCHGKVPSKRASKEYLVAVCVYCTMI